MNEAIHGEGAKIYQFPLGGRAGAASLTNSRPESRFAREVAAVKAMGSVVGDSWYHDEAIADDKPLRKS
ncbi:DUF2735 domain-containing protein [Ancylobacter sp. A5.8]|uniref:DUF2735 domain-containing protein n=1 Tax=Ancylobacter gelatini TaxID=2919920 RepID=UPI001F4EFDF8|nr:DUF2735 domain-containing protein [Ancylobacter gelatini]MCJ8142401.1 DUF2735 domain-containing protein [Ancylobacter gelatini]